MSHARLSEDQGYPIPLIRTLNSITLDAATQAYKNRKAEEVINACRKAGKQHLADYVEFFRALEHYTEQANADATVCLKLRRCLEQAKYPGVISGDCLLVDNPLVLSPATEAEIRDTVTPALQAAKNCLIRAQNAVENPTSIASQKALHAATADLMAKADKMQGSPSLLSKTLGLSLAILGGAIFLLGCFGLSTGFALLYTPLAPLMPLAFVASFGAGVLGAFMLSYGVQKFCSGFDRSGSSYRLYDLAHEIDYLPNHKTVTIIPKGFSFFAPKPPVAGPEPRPASAATTLTRK